MIKIGGFLKQDLDPCWDFLYILFWDHLYSEFLLRPILYIFTDIQKPVVAYLQVIYLFQCPNPSSALGISLLILILMRKPRG